MPKRTYQSIHEWIDDEVCGAIDRYRRLLSDLPRPGTGFNPALLPVAHAAQAIGLSENEFAGDVFAAVKPGTREVSRAELHRAFHKQPCQGAEAIFTKPRIDKIKLEQILEEGRRLGPWWTPYYDMPAQEQSRSMLAALFDPEERIWCGRTQPSVRGRVMTCAEWRAFYCKPTSPNANTHVIINPLGVPGCTKDGRPSQMADANVSEARHILVEFDEMTLEDQVAFWSGLDEPRLLCLTYSGGKSIHGILDVSDMPYDKAQQYFLSFYGAMGADPSCRNRARQTRLAGCFNAGTLQQLLYLKGN